MTQSADENITSDGRTAILKVEEHILNRDFIAKHWYANVYEQFENQTNDVEFLLDILHKNTNGDPQNILEVACGGGRISVPLAGGLQCHRF